MASGARVAIGPNGEEIVIWTYFNDAEVVIQASTRAVGVPGYTAPVTISAGGSGEPEIASDAAGNATAVWFTATATNRIIEAVDRPAGGSFSTPQPISNEEGTATAPRSR